MRPSALEAPIIVLNSFGFSGAETLATFIASHAQIGLLPGQNFIQQANALYRPLRFPTNDACACFDLLATKQYTKGGMQWAGLGKFMSDELLARYSFNHHRDLFIESYELLSTEQQLRYTTLVKLYSYSFFLVMGEDPTTFARFGFYGSNLLLNACEYPEFFEDTIILQVKPTPSEWLSLASQSRTWNPDKAFGFYIIQNLFIALCEKRNSNIHSVSYQSLTEDTQNALDACCQFLDIENCDVNTIVAGNGHAPATVAYFDKIRTDANTINEIYQHSHWFEVANSMDNWSDDFLNDADSVALLDKYQSYWNSTAHIAFDWSGPLEQQIKTRVCQFALSKLEKHKQTPGVGYHFYQQWHESQSINHTQVNAKPCYPLGDLENEIPLPKLQYFLRIAIHYIHSSVELQAEQLHSYKPTRESRLYQTLCEDEYQQAIDRNWLRVAFDAMQADVEKTQRLFDDLKISAQDFSMQQYFVAPITSSNISAAKNSSDKQHKKTPVKNKHKPVNANITVEEIETIAVSGPDIGDHEKRLVDNALSDWYKQPYYYCEEFERRFAEYHEREYALMTPSCTSANHLLLSALGLGAGDEILVPESTWIASATPSYYTGATPVFCDIDADDWCISLESAEKNLSANTRAIIVVNLYGNMAKMDKLERFAKANNLYLIEDAAESIGACYKGKKSGGFGVGSVFSFHRTKTLTTGEGGMLLLDDKALFERCTKLRDHGRGPDTPAFMHEMVGYKYMPFNVQAALGLGQLDRLESLVDKKRHILHYYKNRFANYDGIVFNQENEDVYNGAWCSTLVLGSEYQLNKPTLMGELHKKGIPTRPFFYPLSSQPAIRAKLGRNVDLSLKNPVAFDISKRGINLPSALNLSDAQLNYVCSSLEQLLDESQNRSASKRKKAA